jgi:transcriptional regulator with XRE-family HTH domain
MPARPDGNPQSQRGQSSSTKEDEAARTARKAAKDAARKRFADNLKQTCELLGITAARLGLLCDVSDRVAEGWLRAGPQDGEPCLLDLGAIRRAIGVSLDDLIGVAASGSGQPSAADQAFALAIIQRVFDQQRGRIELSFYGNPAASPQRLLYLPEPRAADDQAASS